ncbi:helix-turn-helix domain-containing protein [Paenibacillus ginsengihumi]|uniref:helix-turn-helix domain-containing protein n=1 Tax=Paenibacillus ginsengihumi TaxID=431596 RepID=UPI000371992F|nr:helix-turn-helix domain-containing protein [Paenibacillus ginsengihumi]
MTKSWYNRLLLSYVPILFFAISMTLFIAISLITEYSFKETEKANQVFTNYVVHSIENSLRAIERAALEQISTNEMFTDFYQMKGSDNVRVDYYNLSNELRTWVGDNALIHSIYLYRKEDNLIITPNVAEYLDEFSDQAHIRAALDSPPVSGWSSVREYTDLALQPADKVITLTRRALLPFGGQGLIVVNVKLDRLMQFLEEMINRDITFMHIMYRGDYVYTSLNADGTWPVDVEKLGKVVTRYHSDYIGWDFVSGIRHGQMFGWMSVISNLWIAIALGTVLLSILYTIYVTRRNYKPIEGIMRQIEAYQNRNSLKSKGGDEFSFIQKVLASLMDQTEKYEKQYQEDLIVRRKQFFLGLIDGGSAVGREEWEDNASRFRIQASFTELVPFVIEIDKYADFQQKYSARDQSLLKFALSNVVHDFFQGSHQSVWAEWLTADRLALLAIIDQGEQTKSPNVADLVDKLRTWVAVNLHFSVTAGIGRAVRQLADLPASFDEANSALQYKMSLGCNQVIRYEDIRSASAGGKDMHKYYQLMDGMCTGFRLADDAWELQVDQLAQYLAQDLLTGEEMEHLLQYLTGLLQRSMEGMPEEIAELWEHTAKPAIQEACATAETMEDILLPLTRSLKLLHEQYMTLRKSKHYHRIMNEIRAYIEENYANPDLSLSFISERFDLNGKYMSQLFKEAFGMKFVDFMVNVRMERAKELLIQTDDSIQDIAVKVGYTHSISFGRTFKKIVGVTPGDYRKMMNAP